MKQFGLIVLVGSIVAALFVASAPNTLYWGERHEAHEKTQRLILKSGERIGQTFLLEENALSGIAVWVDMKQPLPTAGNLALEVEIAGEKIGAAYDVRNIPESGIIVFPFEKAVHANKGDTGTYMLVLSEQNQNITLLFQIDAAIYADGSLVHPNSVKQGDLAFQLLYSRPAFGSRIFHIGYAVLLIFCGYIVWHALRKYPGEKIVAQKTDILLGLSIAFFVTLFYGILLFRSGYWVGPTDFTKDAAYLGAAASSFKDLAWPNWMHTICGGLPVLGAIEGNTISIGTLFALFMDSQHALMLMNILEVGIAAAGAYMLARFFSGSKISSVFAAGIYGLSPVYIFKLSIGYSMIGGVYAFAPWILLFFISGITNSRALYAVLSGVLLGLTVLRGEAHIIVALGGLLVAWSIYDAIISRRIRALMFLLVTCCMAFFISSIKILPYIEHVSREPVKLKAYVAPLLQDNLLFTTLLTVSADHESVPVLHGKFGEEWGVFGSYVGYVPVLLACMGLFVRKKYRIELGLLLVVSFILAEGTLFEYFLRHVKPLDALLRMPVRNMLLVVLLVAIVASRGLDAFAGFFVKYKIGYIFLICITMFVVIDLSRAVLQVTTHSMNHFEQIKSPTAEALAFANYEVWGDPQKNANILLARGFILPQVCADQNRTVAFIKDVKPDTPFASVPAQLTPNKVILSAPSGVRDMYVNTRFDTMWTSTQAYILENRDGSLHVISHGRADGDIILQQISPTKRAQQVIVITVLLYLTAYMFYEKVTIWPLKK